MTKLEELLNKLIEKGWKRKGKEKIEKATIRLSESWQVYFGTEEHPYLYADTLRGITSKNSGLWQFVCENRIIENGKTVHDYVISHITYSYDKGCGGYAPNNSEFWIMMSALCDEDKLEEFLLDNIKIDG